MARPHGAKSAAHRSTRPLSGRRGTGKTHALSYLEAQIRERGDVAVYVDMRTIGSTGGIYGDIR